MTTTTMSELTIRSATAADIPAITAIYGFEVREKTASFELTAPDEAEMARRLTALTTGGFPYLVATVDGHLAGYAYAGPYRPRPAYRYTVEDSVYLDPAYYHRGIGRALLTELIAECTMRGFRQIIAVIGDSANAASIGLHRSAGFAMIGTHPNVGFKFGRWLDSVQMQLAIGEGARTVPPS